MTGGPLTMGGMAIVSLGAALAFALLATAHLARRTPLSRTPYVVALFGMAIWLGALALAGTVSESAWIGEAVRNIGWLWFMASIAGRRPGMNRISPIGWIYIGLFSVEAVLVAMLVVPWLIGTTTDIMTAPLYTLQMLFCAGALVLLHNLHEAATAEERRALALPLAAIAALWAYDLNLYVISYLSAQPASLLLDLRALAALAVALVLAIASLRPAGHAIRLSRPVAFRSVALAAVAGWLVLLSLFTVSVEMSLGDFGNFAQIVVLAGTLSGALVVVRSARLRSYVRVWTAKHFFEHRYDYRSEWLRFTATLSRRDGEGLTLDARVIKAIADIVESAGGALFTADGSGRFTLASSWPQGLLPVNHDFDLAPLAHWMAASERIVQFDQLRSGSAPLDERHAVPATLLDLPNLWIAVPLLHQSRIEGLILLTRPPLDRALDWEDFDLLKVAGRQAASDLAEARGTAALAESARFEEFHRRFAFMMHDVKNLASQMSLLARNVERHGDNPEFREDMVVTLRLSADRLSQMMQRLSQQEKVRIGGVGPVDIAAVAMRVAVAKRGLHPVQLLGDSPAPALADAETLEQLLIHLVQNAIDASAGGAPVSLRFADDGAQVHLSVEDHGIGMSAEFVRNQLFRPFSSTKDGGFGIGTYQARQLATAMGGSLSVESREGEGSVFTLSLPRADNAISSLSASPQNRSEAA